VRLGLTSTRRIVAVAALALTVVGLPSAFALLRAAPTPAPSPVAELLVVGGGANSQRSYRVPIVLSEWVPGRPIELRDAATERVRDPWVGWPMIEIPTQRGTWVTSQSTGDSGIIDVFVEKAGARRRVTFAKGDDLLGDVSPDGRRAAVSTGRWNEDSHYDIAIVSLEDGTTTAVTKGEETDAFPRWSRAGDRIAFLRRSWVNDAYRLCVVNPDGSDLACPETWLGTTGLLGWIDDDRLLAMSERDGRRAVVVADTRDATVRPIGLEMDEDPVLSPDGNWLACRCERLGYGPGTWFVMPLGRESEARPITIPPDFSGARVAFTSLGRRAPISALSIHFGISAPVVGVPHQFVARAIMGNHLSDRLARVRWHSDDPAILTIDSLTGVAGPRRPGRARVHATLPGWRTAALDVAVQPGLSAAVAREPWDSTWATRWFDYGTPRPVVVQRPTGPMLNVNGDGSFSSGVLSRQVFAVAKGLSVEADVSLRLTRLQWQQVQFGLAGPVDVDSVSSADRRNGIIRSSSDILSACSLALPAGEGISKVDKMTVADGLHPRNIPLPASIVDGRLARVRLQLFPDGRCGIAIDGRAVFISQAPTVLRTSARIHYSGNAVKTQALLGPLEIWTGVRDGVDWSAVPLTAVDARPAERVPPVRVP